MITLSQNWSIYTLSDPLTECVRYVGYTSRPVALRFRAHLNVTWRNRTHVGHWIKGLIDQGLKPLMAVVQSGTGDGWKDAERRWIADLSLTADLCNHTQGGDGGSLLDSESGRVVRRKRSASMKARWNSRPEWKEQKRAEMTERMKDPSLRQASSDRMAKTRAAILSDPARRESHFSKLRDPERCAKHSEFMKKRSADPDYIAARRRAQPAANEILRANAIVRCADPATRAAMSSVAKERMKDPAAREVLRRATTRIMNEPARREKSSREGKARMAADPQERNRLGNHFRERFANDAEFRAAHVKRLADVNRQIQESRAAGFKTLKEFREANSK